MNFETSTGNSGVESVFLSFKRTDIAQITNILFYHNEFYSAESKLQSIGRFRIQLLINGKWDTK